MKLKKNARWVRKLALVVLAATAGTTHAALLAYEPFTNTIGANILGSGGGFGFNGVWQINSSLGVATNTAYALSYTDAASNILVTAGNAAFFQGSTSANSAMQPIRLFNFARGTNGTDGGTTWISFLIWRRGPTGTLAGNPYGKGANVPHDINTGALQKLAIGNGSGALSNTVALIPQGSGGNIKGATNIFGGVTNFVVVRLNHVTGAANDNAYLFVNPPLATEPSTNSAGAVSLSSFDFSFDRLRIFAGGQVSADQPFAETVVDEYRIGTNYADVAPIVSNTPPVAAGSVIITNATLATTGIVLAGTGGENGATYFVLAHTNLFSPATNWPAISTNTFDANGNFVSTNPAPPNAPQQFYRLFTGSLPGPPPVAPTITTDPTNQTVLAGANVSFDSAASGTAPLKYQWYFNTTTVLATGTNATLTISNAQSANGGNYLVIVTNAAGSATSAVATLTVNVPPSITTQPISQSVIVSNNATFTLTAAGTAPLRYQWYFNTNTALAAATNASLTVTNAQFTNAGAYSAIVTNNFGAVTSSFVTLTVTTNPVLLPGAYFVATNGNDTNPGTFASPFKTITKGLNTITTSGTIYIRGGVYVQASEMGLSRTGATNLSIRVWAYPGERPIIDSTGTTGGADGIGISGRNYHLRGLEQRFASHNGIAITGSSNLVEYCIVHGNTNTGIHITDGSGMPAYNVVSNCDSYLNFDPPVGGNADGFSAKWDIGPGNVFVGCRAWWNSDDGWDLWMGINSVLVKDCWAFKNGTNYWNDPGFNGNGNGFKMGGNYVGTPHRWLRCVSFKNEKHGFDRNNNLAVQTLDNNTSWANKGKNYYLDHPSTNNPPHIVRNNISLAGAQGDTWGSSTIFSNNTWQVLSDVNTSDFQSMEESVATAPRNDDGSLPAWPFLRPVPGGRLIDKGVDIGEPFTGTKPDLGAFEDGL